MAFANTNPAAASGGFLKSLVAGLGRGLTQIAEHNTRLREVERLQRLSDDQLAARGIKREDIARHVYRDMLYI